MIIPLSSSLHKISLHTVILACLALTGPLDLLSYFRYCSLVPSYKYFPYVILFTRGNRIGTRNPTALPYGQHVKHEKVIIACTRLDSFE